MVFTSYYIKQNSTCKFRPQSKMYVFLNLKSNHNNNYTNHFFTRAAIFKLTRTTSRAIYKSSSHKSQTKPQALHYCPILVYLHGPNSRSMQKCILVSSRFVLESDVVERFIQLVEEFSREFRKFILIGSKAYFVPFNAEALKGSNRNLGAHFNNIK